MNRPWESPLGGDGVPGRTGIRLSFALSFFLLLLSSYGRPLSAPSPPSRAPEAAGWDQDMAPPGVAVRSPAEGPGDQPPIRTHWSNMFRCIRSGRSNVS